ncbi:MAG: NTP transferase domain-containing protein [Planctomycetota bacterium]|nr:MAG: NTP transferase domain-containing protein [Planctomycetota bacterium]
MSADQSSSMTYRANDDKTIAGVILCGGAGTRMGRTRRHKVCEPVLGRSMIVRLIDTLRVERVDPLVVVVGYRAGNVIETIGASHPGVFYVYQRDRLGTGHAARIGIEALRNAGYDGPVLITMGDKWFEPELVKKALRRFHQSRADLLLISAPKRSADTAGRLVKVPGRGVIGIVERRDIDRSLVLGGFLAMASKRRTLSRSSLRKAGLKYIRPAQKLWRALGPLGRYARGTGTVRAAELAQSIRETGTKIVVGSYCLDPHQVEKRSDSINQSIYIGNINTLQSALRRIGRDNAQDEYYLTDVIALIADGDDSTASDKRRRVVEYKIRRNEAMAFNTRKELSRVEERLRKDERKEARLAADKQLTRSMRRSQQWLDILKPASIRGRSLIELVYGVGGTLVKERLRALRKVVRLFAHQYGPWRELFLVRAPGRINLMGRHIDHQGGFIHAMALDSEVVMAVAPRNDDVIRLVNTEPVAFPSRELVITDWRNSLMFPDWLSFVDSDVVRSHLMSTAGDWSNYVLASAVYQQYHHRNRRLRGMDVAVHGNVPRAAGLSSSSSMVVATMEAICAVNALRVTGSEVVNFSGEAEWFVGSRGGSADHAAIRLGKAGHAVRIGFHPFKMSGYVPIPLDAAVLIAFSGQHAVKSAGARDRFNERVACYRLGILLLKKKYPGRAARLEHVCHLSPSRRVVNVEQTRQMLNDLPQRITRQQLRRKLGPAFADRLERIFASHGDPGQYTIRDVVAYGVGECERSRISANYLKKNDLTTFGELMQISHDGDRINGKFLFNERDDKSEEIPLHRLIGAYACSTENIDEIVDIALTIPGVYGAQIAGAGLGGCVMILARRSAVARIKRMLTKEYYYPRALPPTVWEVRSVNGGGIIRP